MNPVLRASSLIYTIYISFAYVFRHLTPKEYDLEITRCIQSNVVRQQQQEKDFLDEHQDHLKQQQLPQLQPRLQQQLPCQTLGNSDPMTLNMNSETGDVQHPYIRSNENNSSSHFCQSTCEQGGSWENTAQGNPSGSYVDFLGPQSVSVKRSRFDQGRVFTSYRALFIADFMYQKGLPFLNNILRCSY